MWVFDLGIKLFEQIPEKDVVLWTAMFAGFAKLSSALEAIGLFRLMLEDPVTPNSITFASVILACSHIDSLLQGKSVHGYVLRNGIELDLHFRSMRREYRIVPKEEHFACMVDLLGRAGRIDEALSLILYMPMDPGASTWGALLSACRIHQWMNLAEDVGKKLLTLETNTSSVYVLLLNIYADAGMWDMVKKIMLKFGEKEIYKTSGFRSIEVNEKLNVFTSKTRLAYWSTEIGRL